MLHHCAYDDLPEDAYARLEEAVRQAEVGQAVGRAQRRLARGSSNPSTQALADALIVRSLFLSRPRRHDHQAELPQPFVACPRAS